MHVYTFTKLFLTYFVPKYNIFGVLREICVYIPMKVEWLAPGYCSAVVIEINCTQARMPLKEKSSEELL